MQDVNKLWRTCPHMEYPQNQSPPRLFEPQRTLANAKLAGRGLPITNPIMLISHDIYQETKKCCPQSCPLFLSLPYRLGHSFLWSAGTSRGRAQKTPAMGAGVIRGSGWPKHARWASSACERHGRLILLATDSHIQGKLSVAGATSVGDFWGKKKARRVAGWGLGCQRRLACIFVMRTCGGSPLEMRYTTLISTGGVVSGVKICRYILGA